MVLVLVLVLVLWVFLLWPIAIVYSVWRRIGKGSKRVPGMRRRRTGALAYGAPVMWSATACHATRN